MQRVYTYLDRLLKTNDTVIVACSSGPDSMCLLSIMLEYKNKKNINLICAHVNHNVREESIEEEAYIREFCKENNIELEYMKIEKYDKYNFHADARNKRYQFLKNISEKHKANYVMTAHHGDDLVETMLMKIIRGSTIKGVSGINIIIPFYNSKLVRPLLFVTKKDCITYNENNNIKYYIDSSNNSDDYLRNRIRHHILPELKKENENIHTKFMEFSNELILTNNYIEKETQKYIKNVYNNKVINITELKKLDLVIQIKIIEFILKETISNLDNITKKHINLILDLINSTESNSELSLPNNYVVYKSYNDLMIIQKKENDNYKTEFKGELNIAGYGKLKRIDECNETSNYYCYLNSSTVKLPLYVRNRKNGDKLSIKNMTGTKKVKDVYIDSKIPKIKRESYPLLVDAFDNILWIPGIKKTKFDSYLNKQYDIIIKYEEEKNENQTK